MECDHQWIFNDFEESDDGEYLDVYECGLCGQKLKIEEGGHPDEQEKTDHH